MSLSIDYITMPPKSQEVSQIQHSEQVKYDQANQELASQFQEQVKQSSEQTVRRAKAENKEFRYNEKDRKGKGKRGSGQNKRSNQDRPESSEEDLFSDVSRFDMRV
ncbi:MAG: hypothetical protein J5979_02905 [Lachnospiraceae bacterium]|nr:hypothetical protein [Lachnospiraceae bacterium]